MLPNSGSKGIILAGGRGTRLWPVTLAVSKQLLPVAGRPMIYFPLATLMLAGIREVLVVASPGSYEALRTLIGDGSGFGIRVTYVVQPEPLGIAHGFGLGLEFLENSDCLAILGDNFFYGPNIGKNLESLVKEKPETTVFVKRVFDPGAFGVAELDADGNLLSVEEKPPFPKSNFAVTGLYRFKHDDLMLVDRMKLSKRGELEITDLIANLSSIGKVNVQQLPRSTYWSDMGTFDALHATNGYVNAVETTQNFPILSPELVAFESGWIDRNQIEAGLLESPNSHYARMIYRYLAGID